MLVRMWEKTNPHTWLYISTTNMENSMEAPQKPRNRTAIWSSIITSRDIPNET
jgi:hypothetical protein